ncbi:flavoprotein [Actinocrispum wychmicini]|uniref:Flavoprotein n=1 Tax=Actinocrispum wychmicini TaxID=1213861 RepID=A0A4R2JY96_9PSEU|nr:flavoprotein [Actinocrispum wychmicini]TCO65581.1 flavoprotein [Actinocrispum wychmicini]
MAEPKPTRVLYLVSCAAPPILAIGELIRLLQAQGWTVCLVPTPRAAGWIDAASLATLTGYSVRHDYKQPEEPDTLPRADAIAVAPATFNTINKWVAGISDTFALGLLNEALGLKLPVTVTPYAKPTLAAHPVFKANLMTLSQWGVNVLPNEIIRPRSKEEAFVWGPVVAALTNLDT